MEDNKILNEESTEEVVEEIKEEIVEEVVEEEKKPMVKNITSFDYKTMKYLNYYIIKYKRKTLILYIIFSIITIGVGVYSAINSYLSTGKIDFVMPILFVLLAGIMIYQGLTVEKSLDKQLVQFFNNKEITIQETEIDEENLYIARGHKDEMGEPVKIDWVNINEIHELPQYYYLFIGKNPIVIDKNPEAYVNGTSEEFNAIIKEKCGSRKHVVIDKDILKTPITYVHQAPQLEEQKSQEEEQKEE